MEEGSIHCAGCKVDLGESLGQAQLPECRHLFCESCYYKGHNQSTGCFTCPLDWTSSSNPSQNFHAFKESSSRWKQAQSTNNRQEAVHYYQEMLACLNFILYPCIYEPNHPDFATCRFDHSLGCTPKLALKEQGYCERCRAFTQESKCPRCGANPILRKRPKRTKQPYQNTYTPELSKLKAKCVKFRSLE